MAADDAANPIQDVIATVMIVDVASRGGEDTVLLSVTPAASDDEFLVELCEFALGTFPDGNWVNFGPDSQYREIAFVCDDTTMRLRSWHPIYESNPTVVATSRGLTPVGDRERDEILRSDDPAYIRQRNAFDEIEARLLSRFKR